MTVSKTSTAKSMVQEATETLTQTKAEAAKGDQQAVRKLASNQAAQAAKQPATVVDSNRGRLNAQA
jgi:hypothetical protein